jgi:hypothetical protein
MQGKIGVAGATGHSIIPLERRRNVSGSEARAKTDVDAGGYPGTMTLIHIKCS